MSLPRPLLGYDTGRLLSQFVLVHLLVDFAQEFLETVAVGQLIDRVAHAEIQRVRLSLPVIEGTKANPDSVDRILNRLRIVAVENDAEFVAAVAR